MTGAVRGWAELYLELGWVPVPVPFRGKGAILPGWQNRTVEGARASFDQDFPEGVDQNIGLVLGEPSGGLADVDLDCPEAIEIANRFLPLTMRSGRVGADRSHWWYVCTGAKTERLKDRLRVKKGNKKGAILLEIRAVGAQTVVPPSIHESGEEIAWVADGPAEPRVVETEELRRSMHHLGAAVLLGRYWPGKGARHDAQLALAGGLLEGGLSDEEALRILRAVCFLAGDEDPDKRAATIHDTRAKLLAGERVLGWGSLTQLVDGEVVKEAAGWTESVRVEVALPAGVEARSELANAYRLIGEHGADIRMCRGMGWLVWDGCRWQADADSDVRQKMTEVARRLPSGSNAAVNFRRGSLKRSGVENAIEMCSWLKEVRVEAKELDADPWLLNVANGTVDLRTGRLREAKREDLLTKTSSIAYDSEAKAPQWLTFLDRILGGDVELVAFVQRLVGYSLTGSTMEQVFALLWGEGANGKTTLLETLRRVMGDYAANTMSSTLMSSKGGRGAENDIARLRGARVVTAAESTEEKRLDEERIKRLTGSDPVTARFLYQEYFEFVPQFKLWLATNHKPMVKDSSLAMWRRVVLVPFTVTIPEEEQDPELGDKLAGEGAGILRWAVAGCLAWQERGLDPPEVVRAATAVYRAEQNDVARFVEEECEVRSDATSTSKSLYERYVFWCAGNGEHRIGQNSFSERLLKIADNRWQLKRDGKRGRYWLGIGLHSKGAGWGPRVGVT